MSEIRQRQNYQNFKSRKTFVEKLPFWNRYRRGLIFGGSLLTFCFVYSAPLYYFFRTPPDYVDPRSTLWPGELAARKTYPEQCRDKLSVQQARAAEAEAKKAADATGKQ